MMHTRRFCLVVLAVFGLSSPLLAVPAAAGESMAATVRLNVRSGPGLEHQVLDTLHKGERVLVTQCRDVWCQIVHVGINGWVYAPYLVSAQYAQSWGARSGNLPATLPNDTTSGTMPDLSVTLGRGHW